MGGGIALPRIRTRVRRRKPRGPEWRSSFRWLCWCLLLAALFVLMGWWLFAAAMALDAWCYARELRWWPADPEAAPPTVQQRLTNLAVAVGAAALGVAGVFVDLVGAG